MTSKLVATSAKVDTINEATTSAKVDVPDGASTTALKANTIGKSTSDLTINLGHSNATTLTYLEDYSNASQLTDTNTSNTTGTIEAGDLNILRFNDFVIVTVKFTVDASPDTAFAEFNLPTRFLPDTFHGNRQQVNRNANSAWGTIMVDTANPALRIETRLLADDSLPAAFAGSTDFALSIYYYK